MFSQAEIECRTELEQRLKEAEEALQELEKGLNSMERSSEMEQQMKGNVTQLRSECHHAHAHAHADNIRVLWSCSVRVKTLFMTTNDICCPLVDGVWNCTSAVKRLNVKDKVEYFCKIQKNCVRIMFK